MKQIINTSILLLILLGCKPKVDKPKYDIIITDIPANMKELNSEYDDYNSNLTFPAQRTHLFFSSNRNSKGDNFDIVENPLDFSYHSEDDVLNLSTPNDFSGDASKILPVINTDKNEYGPYSFHSGNNLIFMYATNSTTDNKYDIKYVELTNWNGTEGKQVVSLPNSIKALSNYKDDLYPTLTQDNTTLYFCSNQNDTVFNIYKADYKSIIDISKLTNDNDVVISKDTILSSSYNDKCPFINQNLMVFTSNRKGGYGGYDLWYSYYKNNGWSEPINFGNKINTEYDEYRPITFQILNYNLMIFSSNRLGGKGGFDLYIVKITDMIK